MQTSKEAWDEIYNKSKNKYPTEIRDLAIAKQKELEEQERIRLEQKRLAEERKKFEEKRNIRALGDLQMEFGIQ